MKLQHLLSLTRKAVDEYQMIEENDRIAVGISGGKDSLTLLYALHGLRRFYPKPFTLHAVTVDLGFPERITRPSEISARNWRFPTLWFPQRSPRLFFRREKKKIPVLSARK